MEKDGRKMKEFYQVTNGNYVAGHYKIKENAEKAVKENNDLLKQLIQE
jgi:hypothetical protein